MRIEKRAFKCAVLASVLALVLFNMVFMNVNVVSAQVELIVTPEISTASPGDSFEVEIKITNVNRLAAWQFYLRWDSAVLNVTDVVEGPFLNKEGAQETFFVPKLYNDEGYIQAYCTILGEAAKIGVTGTGIIASVTFLVETGGECVLDVYETKLLNPDNVAMSHAITDGAFAYPLPIISVEPLNIIDPSKVAGSELTVNVTIADVAGLYSWRFNLSWTPALLNVTDVVEGPFLSDQGSTSFTYDIDQEGGALYANCTLVGEPTAGVDGEGTLATVTFLVEAVGSTDLAFSDSGLADSEGTSLIHVTMDGYFNNILRDIAVKSIDLSATTVTAGDSVTISVVVENQGTTTESFDVTVYYGTKVVSTKPVANLLAGDETTLTFLWGTANVAAGEYEIKAVAQTLSGETDTADNTLTAADRVTVLAAGQTFPIELIVVAVVVVVVVGVGLFLFMRRRGSAKV